MAIKPLEIIVGTRPYVREVSLKYLAQVAFDAAEKTIHYVETKKGKILLLCVMKSKDEILEDGTYLVRYMIISVYYVFLEEGYKKWLTYDHSQGKAELTDDNDSINTHPSTQAYQVFDYPDLISERVLPSILKRHGRKNKKSNSLN